MFTWVGQPRGCAVMLYVGEGLEREQWRLLHSLSIFSRSLRYPQSNWALLMLIPKCVCVCVCSRPLWVYNKLSCEAGSFSCCCLNPYRCLQSEVWGLLSRLELWVAGSATWSTSCSLALPHHNPLPHGIHQPPLPCESSPPSCPAPPLPPSG